MEPVWVWCQLARISSPPRAWWRCAAHCNSAHSTNPPNTPRKDTHNPHNHTHARYKTMWYSGIHLSLFCIRAGRSAREIFPGMEMVIQAQKGNKSLQPSPQSVSISRSLARRKDFQSSSNGGQVQTRCHRLSRQLYAPLDVCHLSPLPSGEQNGTG